MPTPLPTTGRTLNVLHPSSCARPLALQALLEDVGVQTTQHDTAVAAHAEVLDSLLSLHRERTGAAQARFHSELKAVQDEFER